MINKIAKKIKKKLIDNPRRTNIIKKHFNMRNDLNLKQFGNDYGGYSIAIDELDKDKELTFFSFGIGEDLSFDEDVINGLNAKIYAFDPTPRTITFVENHWLNNDNRFEFFPYGLSNADMKQIFYLPKVKEHVSCSTHKEDWVGDETCEVEMKSFETIVNMLNIHHIDYLKMDIEGSEFDVMDQVLSSGVYIGQIGMEIHDFLFSDGSGLNKLDWILNLISQNGYELAFRSSGGNEMTFIKRK